MPPDLTLVIDAGTSALRAVTVSADGGVAVVAREPWNTVTPEDAAPFGRELDATSAQAALLRAIAAARGESHIAGIAFTGQREGLVFVDDAGDALLVSPNVDARAAAAGMAIDAKHAAEVYRATGHLPSLMQAAAKLAWMREHRPRDAARVRYAMPLADWLASTLTGERRASRCLLVENGLLDITAAAPFDALGSPSGAGSSIAPPSVADGSIVGACRSGDTAQLPVVLCGGDTQCALVGTGAVEAGAGAVAAGWSAPVQIVTPSVVFDAAMRTWAGLHVVPDRWIVESNAGETGRVWEWLLSMLGVPASDADAAAAASPAGAHDVMAVLGPARMNAAAMNAGVGGLTFPLPIVMSAPDRGDLLRAALEATAFAIRANLKQAEHVAGVRAPELRLGGGMSRSDALPRILADVIDRPVYVASTPETSALGAAALAAPALGVHDSLTAALAAMVRPSRIVEPAARTAAQYEDLYERWLAMCETFGSMP